MNRAVWIMAALFLASSAFAGGMLKKGAVELGGSFSLSIQDGERYTRYSDGSVTVINFAAEPGGFVRNGLLLGGYLGWYHEENGGGYGSIEIGPRLAYYFSQSPNGSVFMESSIHVATSDEFDDEGATVVALGLGHLFPLASRVALAPMVNWRYYTQDFGDTSREGYEIEFRIGFKLFNYRDQATGGKES